MAGMAGMAGAEMLNPSLPPADKNVVFLNQGPKGLGVMAIEGVW